MGNTVQIHFFGPISISTVEAFRNMLLNALKSPDIEALEILMSSEGGDLNSGFTAYNYIRSVPIKTTTINMGSVESIAMIPFLAGSERRAVANARFVIHNFTWTFPNVPIDLNRVAERNDSLQTDIERYMSIYLERTQEAEKPIDARLHLTGPAAIIGNDEALRARILTSDVTSFPTLSTVSIYDRLFN